MLSNREAHQRLNAQGFYWGLVIQAPFAKHVTKFGIPKESIYYIVCKHISDSEQFLLGSGGTPPEIEIPRC